MVLGRAGIYILWAGYTWASKSPWELVRSPGFELSVQRQVQQALGWGFPGDGFGATPPALPCLYLGSMLTWAWYCGQRFVAIPAGQVASLLRYAISSPRTIPGF